jgi:hypothetical protein
LFLLLVFAGWAAAFVAGSLARARLPHPRARTTPWWPLAPVAPRSQAHDFRLHRGSYPLTALAALLTGGVVLMLAVLDGGGSGGASLVVLCLSIGWLQVTTARERYPHLHPHLTWISGSRGCPV